MVLTHQEVSGQNMKEYLNLRLSLQAFRYTAIIKTAKDHKIAKETLLWCFKTTSYISAAHIPGKHNIETDQFSRKCDNKTEWKLNLDMFIELLISVAAKK